LLFISLHKYKKRNPIKPVAVPENNARVGLAPVWQAREHEYMLEVWGRAPSGVQGQPLGAPATAPGGVGKQSPLKLTAF